MTRKVWIACAVLALAGCGDDDRPGELDMTPGGDGDVVEPDMQVVEGCGDGIVGAGEMCDTGIADGETGACPTSCDDGDPCTDDALEGSACTSICTITRITENITGDMCCPEGSLPADDGDCAGECGNATVEAGETCDIAIADGNPGACPTSCDDGVACTADAIMNEDSCAVMCTTTVIEATDDGSDGCCPAGATNDTDSNCSATCGDGTVDAGETCDTAGTGADACPTDCDDGDPCTDDRLLSAGTCNALCDHPEVAPADGDSCCPTGATSLNDDDCAAECGNSVVEAGETCDDGNTTPGDGCDGSCQQEPTAMRITSIALRDPHVHFISCSLDATGTANSIFQMAVDDYTLSTVGVFRPLDPLASTTPMDIYPEASCMMDTPTDACMAAGTSVATTANNTPTGNCYTPDPATLDYPGTVPNAPTDNCFVTDPETVTLNLNGAALLLEDAIVAGEYAGDRIENGLLAGFVSYATAMSVMVPNPITGGTDRLYDLLRGGGCTGDDDDPRAPGGA
ncbi:MAG: hypothetical protein GWN73_32630, partial [Actinobacteria bacterium]|nr:hypothetical protein [Actinomycetota bacterium]NIS35146.1 hypothetical protein [Actinomycetota bacterium]NIU69873.1 hypothetical protein [Actinomycetota bacterium]NIW31749.1 hypothetical protein [Actinomycetota bacterium]